MGLRKKKSGAAEGLAEAAQTSQDVGRAVKKELTPARAKRMIGVGKAVAPLLVPYAIAGAGVARERWDLHKARRLGVPPDQLGRYTGRGGTLHARISRIAEALDELESGQDVRATGAARRFAQDTRPRLADLAVAIRAAEQMPGARRRTAFRAVSGELDRVEIELLDHLGIRA